MRAEELWLSFVFLLMGLANSNEVDIERRFEEFWNKGFDAMGKGNCGPRTIMEQWPEPAGHSLAGHKSNSTAGEFHPTVVMHPAAATGTGDKFSAWEHLCMSIFVELRLGLSGQPLPSSDMGGFARNAIPRLSGRCMGVGSYPPSS